MAASTPNPVIKNRFQQLSDRLKLPFTVRDACWQIYTDLAAQEIYVNGFDKVTIYVSICLLFIVRW